MTDFNEDYVKKLRDEAANWRTKFRELEVQQKNNEIALELAKKGIQADPSWVSIEEGQDIGEAVEVLVTKYPHLKNNNNNNVLPIDNDPLAFLEQADFNKNNNRFTPKAISPSSPKSTTPKPARAARITKRNISEIKKDPQARAKIRDLYRDLLTKGSNQGE